MCLADGRRVLCVFLPRPPRALPCAQSGTGLARRRWHCPSDPAPVQGL